MGKVQIIGQNVKGKLQQVKGEIENASGEHLKGNISKLKGKANVFAANVKMKIEETK